MERSIGSLSVLGRLEVAAKGSSSDVGDLILAPWEPLV